MPLNAKPFPKVGTVTEDGLEHISVDIQNHILRISVVDDSLKKLNKRDKEFVTKAMKDSIEEILKIYLEVR